MKNIIMAAVMATVMGVGSAHAQGLYIGVGGEYVKSTAHNVDATAAASLRAGVDINKYIAGELAVNPAMSTNKQHANTNTGLNLLLGYPVDLVSLHVKPYAVIGTGYDFTYGQHSDTIHTTPVYNWGAGVQVGMTKSIALDVRYTRVEEYNTKAATNVVGLGVDYHF